MTDRGCYRRDIGANFIFSFNLKSLRSNNRTPELVLYHVITLKCAAMSIISEMGARKQYTITLQVLRSFYPTRKPLSVYPFSRLVCGLAIRVQYSLRHTGRIVFSVAVLKVADILSRAPRGTAISRSPSSSFSLSSLSFSMSERGKEKSAVIELRTLSFPVSCRVRALRDANARKYVLQRLLYEQIERTNKRNHSFKDLFGSTCSTHL